MAQITSDCGCSSVAGLTAIDFERSHVGPALADIAGGLWCQATAGLQVGTHALHMPWPYTGRVHLQL